MIKKICDKCGAQNSSVCTYTITDKCLNIKQDYIWVLFGMMGLLSMNRRFRNIAKVATKNYPRKSVIL